MKDTTRKREWVALAEAGRSLEVSGPVIRRLINRGALSVRTLPGGRPRVAKTELDHLAAACTRPAQQAS